MAKPTPGPWRVFDPARPRVPATIEVQDAKGMPVVHWMGFDPSHRTVAVRRANARLIALAPEMRDAIQEFVDWCKDGALSGSDRDMFIEKFQSLLAKAGR